MGIWTRLFGSQRSSDPAEVIVGSVRKHLQAMHQHFASSRNYGASAPYWKQLEDSAVLAWLKQCFIDSRGQPGPITKTTREHHGLLICTVIDAVDPNEIRARFAPSGYLSHLEGRGFFDAPQQRLPAAAFILGHQGTTVRVDLSWVPPLDGKAYQAVVAQDVLTARERQEVGI